MTVNMPPVDHRKLKLWSAQAAADLDLPEVAAAEVLRTLWEIAVDDDDLQDRIRQRLLTSGGSLRSRR
ncbi:hypothetical protein [Natronoglycomyces albus]|uniref:Uncharacterized protein n=1 Tax=Natronoglycomyces albus TaxID=2811108 RepID=A0A895XX92_9ACTN|nr:hypothetical protein [Natronoglycomyces albus]QSB07136.1 hypothetical protein JQS30_16795 [Natronoglycomyces albus]